MENNRSASPEQIRLELFWPGACPGQVTDEYANQLDALGGSQPGQWLPARPAAPAKGPLQGSLGVCVLAASKTLSRLAGSPCLVCYDPCLSFQSTPVVPNWGDFCLLPPGTFDKAWRHFLLSHPGEGCYCIRWEESRDAANPPTMHGTPTQQKITWFTVSIGTGLRNSYCTPSAWIFLLACDSYSFIDPWTNTLPPFVPSLILTWM